MSVSSPLLALQTSLHTTGQGTTLNYNSGESATIVECDADASAGPVGMAVLGAFYAGHRHVFRTRLRFGRAGLVRIEVHGLVSRMNKIVAHISRDGTVSHQGEEVEKLGLAPDGDGVLVEMTFRPYNSMVEWIYLFAQQVEPGPEPLFACADTTLQPLPADGHGLARRHLSLGKVEDVDVICQSFTVLRNTFSMVFELSRPGNRLVGLGLTSDLELAHRRWWTWDHAGLLPATGELVACKPAHPIRSPALMDAFGPAAANLGHAITGTYADWHELDRMTVEQSDRLARLTLHARFEDGRIVDLPLSAMLAPAGDDPSRALIDTYLSELAMARSASPVFLEVGARGGASAAVRRSLGASWRYVGLDYLPDANVDIVGDAHCLTEFVTAGPVDAVYSSEVIEHLMSPLRFVLEANRVLRTGGLFIARMPTTWPLHAEPWDFWRLSTHGWTSLLNVNTGFEILERCEIGTASIVPHLAPEGTGLLKMAAAPAPMLTLVIARKIGDVARDTSGWSPGLAVGSYDHA